MHSSLSLCHFKVKRAHLGVLRSTSVINSEQIEVTEKVGSKFLTCGGPGTLGTPGSFLPFQFLNTFVNSLDGQLRTRWTKPPIEVRWPTWKDISFILSF